MKNSIKTLFFCLVLASLFSSKASAVSILNFNGSVLLDTTDLSASTTLVQFFSANETPNTLTVGMNSTGSFAPLAVGTEFTANGPLVHTGQVSIPEPLFELNGYLFILNNVEIQEHDSDFLVLRGLGSIVGPDDFVAGALFRFTTQGPIAESTGRATVSGSIEVDVDDIPNIPEPASTSMLIAFGALAAGGFRRRPLVKKL